MQILSFIQELGFDLTNHATLLQALFILLLCIVVLSIEILVFRLNFFQWSYKKQLKTPIRLLLWGSIVLNLPFLLSITITTAQADRLVTIQQLSFIFILSWIANNIAKAWTVKLEKPGYLKRPIDTRSSRLIRHTLRFVIITVFTLICLQILEVGITSLLAFGSLAGLAIGFSVKDLISDALGSFIILTDRLFSKGDWIRSPDQSIEGIVEKIGWRSTRIRTFDKVVLVTPNSLYSKISIENMSRMSHRRLQLSFGLSYENIKDATSIAHAIEKLLANETRIDKKELFWARLSEFSESTVDIHISAYTTIIDKYDYQELNQTLLVSIASLIESLGGKLAYPTRTLFIEKEYKS